MNRIYKVIWSKVKHQYVVVSELAHSCTKSTSSRVGRSAAAVLAALVLTTGLCAAPVQAEELTDPYALLNAQVEETNSTSSDTLVTLVQSPLVKSVAPLANEDEGQPGEGGSSTVTTPDGQHTIYNEEGFYAHNGQGTYNSLTKDGLFVGGTDNGEGLYVDNDGNIYTDGNAEIEGAFSAADRNFEVNEDGTLYARAGQSQFQVRDDLIGIQQGKSYIAVTEEDGSVFGNGAEGKETQINGDVVTTGTVNTTNLNAGKADVEGTLTAGSAVIEGAATVGGSLTAGSVQTEGQLKAGSAVIDGNTTIGGIATVGGLTTEGTVTANTVDTKNLEADKATVDGKLTAGSANITGDAVVDGSLTAGSLSTEGKLTAGSAAINGNADITGTATVGGLTTGGTVTANTVDTTNLEADKATVEGTVTAGSANITGDTAVGGALTAGSLSTEGKLTAGSAAINGDADITGMATVGGLTTKGTVTANTVDTTNLEADKATVEGTVTAGSADITGDAVVGGSLTAGSLSTEGKLTAGSAAINGDVDITGMATVGGLTTGGTVTAGTVDTTNLEAGKATVDGKLTAGSFANTNGSFTVDESGNVEANDMTAKGDVTGATFANTTDTFTVDAGGNVKAADITSTGNVQATGDVKGATFSNTSNTFNVNAGGDVSAADVTATGDVKGKTFGNTSDSFNVDASGNVKGATFANGNNSFSVGATGNVSANNVTALNEVSGATFGNTIDTFSVDVDGNITGASVSVGDKTYISSTGLNANSQKITNVEDGNLASGSKDAVNAGQLYDVKQSIKTYADGDGITIAGDDNKISVNTGKGLEIADDKVQVKVNGSNLTLDDTNGLSLSTTLTGLTSIGTGSLTATGDVTAASFKVGDKTYISSTGLNANSQKITNVEDGNLASGSKDAVNAGQLYDVKQSIKTYADGDGITIAGDDNKVSVNAGKGLEIADDKVQVKVNGSNLTLDDTNGLGLSTTLTGLTSIG
ncbi:hypothetical protein E0L13_05670, partial [Megasphaera sp. SW808]|uniref:ESPR-type extended signal peptide-containing protein n=1 Tax=Megasphaera sp. SW808 TaxID=2530045 RepID=UPI0014397611